MVPVNRKSGEQQPAAMALLAANERAIGSLYEEYARQLPEHEQFWSGLAAEERTHALWLEELAKAPAAGEVPARPRFTVESIRSFTAYVHEQQSFAVQGTTMAAATATAYNIETALIERRFFEQLQQQTPEVTRVIASLKKDTERHVRTTKNALTRFGTQPPAGT